MSRCHALPITQRKLMNWTSVWFLRAFTFLTSVIFCASVCAQSTSSPVSAERLKALSIATEAGSVSAMVELAGYYLSGSAGRRDPAFAELLYRRAAALGDADAIFHLGNMYLLGDGVPIDEAQALRLFEKAANQGHPLATQNFDSLRAMLEPDESVEAPAVTEHNTTADETRAIELARNHGIKVIFNGAPDPTATTALEEQAVEPLPQPEQSFPLIEGDPSELEEDFLSAEKYYTGEAGKKDDAKAITLYRRAARGGHLGAIERLLEIYNTAGIAAPRCGNVGVDDEICF